MNRSESSLILRGALNKFLGLERGLIIKGDFIEIRTKSVYGIPKSVALLVADKALTIHIVTACSAKTFSPIDKTHYYAFEAQSQSLTGESIAMREPCTIPLHCPQSSRLRLCLLTCSSGLII